MTGPVRLQICQSNAIANRPELLAALLQEFPDLKVYPEECLDRCTTCSQRIFALVNGEYVYAKTPSAFLSKVRAQVARSKRISR